MKQKILDLCKRFWRSIVLCFGEYTEMKNQQVLKIGEADETGNSDEVVSIAEKL